MAARYARVPMPSTMTRYAHRLGELSVHGGRSSPFLGLQREFAAFLVILLGILFPRFRCGAMQSDARKCAPACCPMQMWKNGTHNLQITLNYDWLRAITVDFGREVGIGDKGP
jgi:hypothetical protein